MNKKSLLSNGLSGKPVLFGNLQILGIVSDEGLDKQAARLLTPISFPTRTSYLHFPIPMVWLFLSRLDHKSGDDDSNNIIVVEITREKKILFLSDREWTKR